MCDEIEEQIKALEQINEIKKEYQNIINIRNNNLDITKKIITNNNLKSDLKKTSAFIKKIRVINSEGLLQCLRDIQTLNLTLYISEIVSSIIEINVKANDVPNVIKLCNELHLRYDDFTIPLMNSMKESLLSQEEEALKRRRIQIRMLIEFYQIGLFNEEAFFPILLRDLSGKSHPNQQIDLSGLVTFVKYASEILLGYHPKRHHQLAKLAGKSITDIPSKLIASSKIANELKMQLTSVCEKLSEDLLKSHKDLRSKEKRNEKDKLIHGTLSDQKLTELENCKRIFEKLMTSLSSISDSTGLDIIPELKEEEENQDGSSGISLWEGGANSLIGIDFGPWGDAETKSFYEDLPDLLTMVPLTILGLTPEQANELRESWKKNIEKQNENENNSDNNNNNNNNDNDNTYDDEINDEKKFDDNSITPTTSTSNLNNIVENDEIDSSNSSTIDTSLNVNVMNSKLLTLLQEKLPESVNKVKCDEFCVSFCYINTKKSKKHLVNALLKVPRSRYELIPNYARIAASLIRLYPEISSPLLDGLMKEFHGMLKTKNQQHIENKIKNIRFIGELIKFNIAPPIIAFRIFQRLTNDFVHHNIEICATLLETCGRYLYLTSYTHDRLEVVLDTILRLRRAKNLDYRQQTALEAAYFTVKPPEKVSKKKKDYTVIQKYIQHLLFIKLNKTTVELIIKQLRKLPWKKEEENIEYYIIKFTLKLARLKYSNVPLVTDCLSSLSRYHPNLLTRLVDIIFEELSRGFDAPHHREQQRLISYVRLISELFNFSALSTSIIFDLLYYILTYGYTEELNINILTNLSNSINSNTSQINNNNNIPINNNDNNNNYIINHILYFKNFDLTKVCDIDTSKDYFRIQLICEILESCGMYFTKGTLKAKLNDFLLYFQQYLLLKTYLPNHIEFSVLDMFDNLEYHAHELLKKEKKSSSSSNKNDKNKNNSDDTLISTELCFPRYVKLEEVNHQIQLLEEQKEKNYNINQDIDNDEDEEGDENEDNEDDDGDNDRDGNRNNDNNDDEQNDEQNENNNNNDGGIDGNNNNNNNNIDDGRISESDAAKLRNMKNIEEDEEFEKAFRSVMLESIESAKPSSISSGYRVAVDRMAIPAYLPPPKNVINHLTSRSNNNNNNNNSNSSNNNIDDDDNSDDEQDDDGNNNDSNKNIKKMPFKLLGRDMKGKIETRRILIPEDTKISLKLIQSNEHQKLEKEMLKEKVLLYESMQQASNINDGSHISQSQIPVEYLGNRDHFSRDPSQPTIESSKWRSPTTSGTNNIGSGSGNNQHHHHSHSQSSSSSSSNQNQNQPVVTSYDLNLDDFLAISSASETRKHAAIAPHKGNTIGLSYNSGKSGKNQGRS